MPSLHTLKKSIFLFILIASVTQLNVSARENQFISTIWSRPKMDRFKFGEKFSFKIVPKVDSYIYVFYINQNDDTIQIHPGKPQNDKTIGKGTPLVVDKVLNEVMRVDGQKGKLITVAVGQARHSKQIKNSVLSEEDFDLLKSKNHPRLDIKGTQLLKRFRLIKTEYPDNFHYLVENAPQSGTPGPN